MRIFVLCVLLVSTPLAMAALQPLKIMPLGDSITYGYGTHGNVGYRLRLEQLFLQIRQPFTFVGSEESWNYQGPGSLLQRRHEGHSGWKIARDKASDGLLEHIDQWLKAANPDVILLMIGTNDLWLNRSREDPPPNVDRSMRQMQSLLERIRLASPNVKLFVGSVIPTSLPWNKNIISFNLRLRKLVREKARHDSKIYFVNLYAALYPAVSLERAAVLGDGVHPNAAGYYIMAEAWAKALRAHRIIRR